MSRKAASRSLLKGNDASIPTPPDAEVDTDGFASKADDDKKPWETDADDTSKADDDEDEDDEDEDDAEKSDDDEDGDKPSAIGKSAKFRRDLQKAITLLTQHGEQTDPALRKEALMAKELKGRGLSKSERQELVSILGGQVAEGSAAKVIRSQAPGAALRKSMVANDAFAEAYDNLTKSVTAQAQHLDGVCKSMEETNRLMARVLTKAADTISGVYDRQEALAEAVESLARQPAHAPRSVGLGFAEKSFGSRGADSVSGVRGGRLEKSSPEKVMRALDEMAKSAGRNSEAGQAYRLAKDSLLLRRPLMPSVAARLEEHLAAQD